MRIDGACHCGRISFEADIDTDKVGLCHCTDCQTLSGSAFTAFVPVPKHAFCPDCGTRMYAAAEKDPRVFNLRIGTVRQRAALSPKSQLWCRSALPWVMGLASVRQHPKQAM